MSLLTAARIENHRVHARQFEASPAATRSDESSDVSKYAV
jgi:hypothetical protein